MNDSKTNQKSKKRVKRVKKESIYSPLGDITSKLITSQSHLTIFIKRTNISTPSNTLFIEAKTAFF